MIEKLTTCFPDRREGICLPRHHGHDTAQLFSATRGRLHCKAIIPMVTLEDFVAETLIQIVRGAARAQKALGTTAAINPPKTSPKFKSPGERVEKHESRAVDFDVQIVAADNSETKGNAGVSISVLTLGTQGQSSSRNESVNRVQFSIPLTFDVREGETGNA